MPLPAGYMFAQKFAAWLAFLCLACCGASAQSDLRTAVSFRNDVMAVLSKAGCNAGACHGNKNGKGGFKLSLRGDDPDADYSALVRDLLGRRINLIEPEESLLRRWIADGAKDDRDRAPKLTRIEVSPLEKFVGVADKVQIKATAYFAGGASRDITRAAVYEANNTLPDIT